jgi:hypothetical protein
MRCSAFAGDYAFRLLQSKLPNPIPEEVVLTSPCGALPQTVEHISNA